MNLNFWRKPEIESATLTEIMPSVPDCNTWALNLFHKSHVLNIFDDGLVIDEFKYTNQQARDTLQSISDACQNLIRQLEKNNG